MFFSVDVNSNLLSDVYYLPTMKQACYIISINVTLSVVYYIIGEFRSYIIGTYFITLSGNFAALLVSCYIIGKFGVTLSVDVTL